MPDPDFRPLAFLMDLDGVLIHSHGLHVRAYERAFERHGLALPERVRDLVRRGTSRERVLPAADVPERLRAAVSADKEEAFLELLAAGVEPAPGSRAFLDRVRAAGCRVAVVSNSATAETCIDALGIVDAVDAVVDVTTVERSKPAPDPWLQATERLDVEPGRCVAVEDSRLGVRSARAAGIYVVGVGDAEAVSDADLVVEDLAAVPLDRWLSAGAPVRR